MANPSDPQAFNRYSYVLNNPILYIDPSGHTPACGFSYSDPECPVATPVPPKPNVPSNPITQPTNKPKPDGGGAQTVSDTPVIITNPDPLDAGLQQANPVSTLPSEGNPVVVLEPKSQDDIATLPIPTLTPSSGTPPPIDQTPTSNELSRSELALIGLGAVLLIGGLLLTDVGVAIVFYGLSEILMAGLGAALTADAAAGVAIGLAFYIPIGLTATKFGAETIIETTATP